MSFARGFVRILILRVLSVNRIFPFRVLKVIKCQKIAGATVPIAPHTVILPD